jgi:phosphoribosylformimino-5-aminoimidazole carboxamide ribotide isomerase
MTLFRPCIDLHAGKVKQIVGGTLSDDGAGLVTNFVSDRSAADYAAMFRRDGLEGGHVIQLGPGNRQAAVSALRAFPQGLRVGGGINPDNAAAYLDEGASHVIVTSHLFVGGRFDPHRLDTMTASVGAARLIVDLSCRRSEDGRWIVACDRWRTLTDLALDAHTLDRLAPFCDGFLIHAADIEGRCSGIDEDLVRMLGAWGRKPLTYAGGARGLADLYRVADLSGGHVDLTIGSALDIYSGTGVLYADCLAFNRRGSAAR